MPGRYPIGVSGRLAFGCHFLGIDNGKMAAAGFYLVLEADFGVLEANFMAIQKNF